jgi:RimJ/RimL family protein N-acetyltransferase
MKRKPELGGLPLCDGIVTIRSSTPHDVPVLVTGRDALSRRFLGDGDTHPAPTACITIAGEVVGWVDFDRDRSWLEVDEVNIGYSVFPAFRGRGYATSAVRLLLRYIASTTPWSTATLLIDPQNERSLALARRLPCVRHGDLDGNPYWKVPAENFRSYGFLVDAP